MQPGLLRVSHVQVGGGCCQVCCVLPLEAPLSLPPPFTHTHAHARAHAQKMLCSHCCQLGSRAGPRRCLGMCVRPVVWGAQWTWWSRKRTCWRCGCRLMFECPGCCKSTLHCMLFLVGQLMMVVCSCLDVLLSEKMAWQGWEAMVLVKCHFARTCMRACLPACLPSNLN
jgi:hypothetical protein